jgi:hypothetical protein
MSDLWLSFAEATTFFTNLSQGMQSEVYDVKQR